MIVMCFLSVRHLTMRSCAKWKNFGSDLFRACLKMLSARCASQFVGDLCQMKGA